MTKASDREINEAARRIRSGELVAFPTETVYGLGADATSEMAVARVYTAKSRPAINPLIVHVSSLDMAKTIGVFDAEAEALAVAIWPGPLTLVVPKRSDARIAKATTAGGETIAIRVPSHPTARALIEASGVPIVAPSANRSGHVSATEAQHVRSDLGERVAMILDGGRSPGGLESTIVRFRNGSLEILRHGSLTSEELRRVSGLEIVERTGTAPDADHAEENGASGSSKEMGLVAPGQLESHYAPRAMLRLNASTPRPGEALIAFGPKVPTCSGPVINLSASGSLVEAAANLFSVLRELDATGVDVIAVMPIPDSGLGVAINDRLRRAAAPRPDNTTPSKTKLSASTAT